MTSKRAEVLANRVEQGACALLALVEKLSEAEWQTVCVGDGRAVGVLVHHVASAYLVEVDLMRALVAGQPIAGVTWDMVNEMNAKHARDHAGVGKQEALALLRKHSAYAANAIRELSDEQLDSAALISLNWDAPLTAQYWIEEHPIGHSFRHLATIRAAVTAEL